MTSSIVMGLRRQSVRRLVGLMLLPGLALRLLMPPGFMPGGPADGGHFIKMCHGAGPVPTAVHAPPDRGVPGPGQHAHHEAPCIFAAAGSVAPPSVALVAAGPVAAVEHLPPAPPASFEQRAIDRAHRARAPPELRLAA